MSAQKTVLLLSDNPGEDYVARLRQGISSTIGTSGCTLTSVNIYGKQESAADVLNSMSYAGVVLTPPVCDDRHILSLIEASRVPYVRIAPLLDPERGNVVTMDEFQAASAITGLLTARGHRRIGIMRGPNSQLVSMRRYNGYTNALGAKGIRVDQSLVAQGDFTRQSGREQAAKLFAAKPTAIFASNDEMAAGIIDAAREAGISIPRDLSIVGYDDNVVASHVHPRLSTVRQPLEAMGEAAGRLIGDRVRNPARPNEYKVIDFKIIERDSVADCRETAAVS